MILALYLLLSRQMFGMSNSVPTVDPQMFGMSNSVPTVVIATEECLRLVPK